MAKKTAAKKETVEKVVEEVKDESKEVEVVAEEPKKEEKTMVKEEKKAEEAPSFKLVSMNGKLMRDYGNGRIGAALPEDYESSEA